MIVTDTCAPPEPHIPTDAVVTCAKADGWSDDSLRQLSETSTPLARGGGEEDRATLMVCGGERCAEGNLNSGDLVGAGPIFAATGEDEGTGPKGIRPSVDLGVRSRSIEVGVDTIDTSNGVNRVCVPDKDPGEMAWIISPSTVLRLNVGRRSSESSKVRLAHLPGNVGEEMPCKPTGSPEGVTLE